jgi:hypothetical protein
VREDSAQRTALRQGDKKVDKFVIQCPEPSQSSVMQKSDRLHWNGLPPHHAAAGRRSLSALRLPGRLRYASRLSRAPPRQSPPRHPAPSTEHTAIRHARVTSCERQEPIGRSCPAAPPPAACRCHPPPRAAARESPCSPLAAPARRPSASAPASTSASALPPPPPSPPPPSATSSSSSALRQPRGAGRRVLVGQQQAPTQAADRPASTSTKHQPSRARVSRWQLSQAASGFCLAGRQIF